MNDSNLSDAGDASFYQVFEESLSQISSTSNKNNTKFCSGNENYNIFLGFIPTKMSHMFHGCKSLISLPD